MAAREPIGVIGTGYVGLVTAAGFAELGNDVWCIDIDAAKVDRLKRGEIPIYEPGLAELVTKHSGRLHFSTDIADALEHARLLFVAVGTPPTYSGDADLSSVNAVVDAMPPSDRHAVVMKSTVPVGTGESIKRIFADRGKEGFRYVSCPEFLKEGSAVTDFLEPNRVVVGDDGVYGREVGIARVGRRRADGDEEQPRVLERVVQIRGEVQAVAVLLDELRETRLPDRHDALLEAVDLGRVDVDAIDVIAEFGEARRGNQADVSRADHADRLSIRGHEGGSGYRGACRSLRA